MIKNIRHIQIKKLIGSPNLFQAIITYEKNKIDMLEHDDIETIKIRDLDRTTKGTKDIKKN